MPLRSLANPRTRWRRSGRGSNAAVARPRDREFLAKSHPGTTLLLAFLR